MDAIDRMVLNALEHPCEPSFGIDAVRLGGLDEGIRNTNEQYYIEMVKKSDILEPIWNPKNKRLSMFFAKPLILWCPHTDSNRGPTDYKSVEVF